MMLKTSSNKVNPATNMFKLGFKRNLGILVLVIIGFLLVCPAYLLINLNNVGTSIADRQAFFTAWNDGFSLFCGIACGIAVVGINLLNFSFMFRRPSSDFTDSLPVKRTELFIARVISGYILSIIPAIISLVSLGIVSLFIVKTAIILRLITNIFYVLLVTASMSAISMIFIVASANVFDFLVSFAGINGGLLLFGLIITTMFEDLLLGYANTATLKVLKAISPPFYAYYGFVKHLYSSSEGLINLSFIIRCAVTTIIFFIFALLLYRKRKTENSGKAFAYKFIYFVCAFLISICASYVFGAIFADGTDYTSPIFYIFALIGALISSVVYGAVTFRGFKTLKKSLIVGGASFAVLVASVFIIKSDLVGFNKKIPQIKDIKYVTVDLTGETITLKDPQFAIDLHKKIINNNYAVNASDIYGPNCHCVDINYVLNNKTTLKRSYWLCTDKIDNEIDALLKSDDRFDGILKKLSRTTPSTVSFYQIDNNGNEALCDSYLTYEECIKFIKIYKQDAKNTATNLSSNHLGHYTISWNGESYYANEFYFDESFEETIKYLDSLNLKDRIQKYEDTLLTDIVYD